MNLNEPDQVPPDFRAYEQGSKIAEADVTRLFHIALAAGVQKMPEAEATETLVRLIAESYNAIPADISVAEMAGRFQGTIRGLSWLAWRGFLALPREPLEGVH